jgi:two-component system, NtrC family, sensor histidine kinase HydH
VLLTNVYARDGRIVWSTNKTLVGNRVTDNIELEQAFASRVELTKRYDSPRAERDEQRFVIQPKKFYIENYVPLTNPKGEVVAVAEVYKEPGRLMAAIHRGRVLVWCTTIAGGLVVWLGLFSIVRRASKLLRHQERQLVEAESRVFIGDMATALAHSLRNPLASVRSSAELALMTDDSSVRKNAHDIITQVDFLSRWVRELLLYSRPITGEAEPVDLCAVLTGVMESFRTSFERANVKVTWKPDPGWRPLVEGNTSLVTQALHGVIANAIEAMPKGGDMRIELTQRESPPGVELLVSDTGVGMSQQQLARAFRPFHTTKAQGLGVGLPMLKRAMERFGGYVTLSSIEQVGTQVRLHFRT